MAEIPSKEERQKADAPLAELELRLAPNPAQGQVEVLPTQPMDKASYKVYDANGQQALSGMLSGMSKTLDISALVPGVYSFCLMRGREMIVSSLVVR